MVGDVRGVERSLLVGALTIALVSGAGMAIARDKAAPAHRARSTRPSAPPPADAVDKRVDRLVAGMSVADQLRYVFGYFRPTAKIAPQT